MSQMEDFVDAIQSLYDTAKNNSLLPLDYSHIERLDHKLHLVREKLSILKRE
jgi:hypothetical protein